MYLYSIGDGTILMHNINKAESEPAKDLNQLLLEINGATLPIKIRSQITWSDNYSQLYIGSEDG